LLTLTNIYGKLLVRFQNIYEAQESPSRSTNFDPSTLFENIDMSKLVEMSLTGVQTRNSIHKMKWKTNETYSQLYRKKYKYFQ
jgi:hypothetical protein